MNFKSSESYEELFMNVSHIIYKNGTAKLSKIVDVTINEWPVFRIDLIQNKELTIYTVNLSN